jgi:outer membrane protein OmpA-like peptidoglycan-associated protein
VPRCAGTQNGRRLHNVSVAGRGEARGTLVARFAVMTVRRLCLAAALVSAAVPAAAQEISPAIRLGAACAPVGTLAADDAPRVAAAMDRMIFNAGQVVTIDRGTRDGLANGQKYFVRRRMNFHGAPDAAYTIGWLTIVDARDMVSAAQIDFACDAIAEGDQLETYAEPVLPAGVDRTEATGALDVTRTARVLYGVDGRWIGGGNEFMLATGGQRDGVAAGARYAVYHRARSVDTTRPPVAEVIVVSVFADKSLVRITDAREEVAVDDMLVPRIGVAVRMAAAEAAEPPVAVEDERVAEVADEGGATANDLQRTAQTITFEDVHFEFDRETLRPDARAMLEEAMKTLTANPALRLYIEGYTCDIGTPEYNLALGERRARAVRDYLVAHGVDAQRLTTVSFGEAEPKYDNGTEESRRLNRRAALVVNMHTGSETSASR